MRIYAICLVKNEDDVIAQSLSFAARYCKRIFVLDNGSTDETWPIVHRLAERDERIVPFEQTTEPFDNRLRAKVYNAVRSTLGADDWWLILDADEFLAEDPRPVIEQAVAAGADLINAWQIQFFFTERDVQSCERGEDCQRPIFERRRHYLINWQESRLFQNDPRRDWDRGGSYSTPDWLHRVCRRRILNRHYQYRDPAQIQKRLRSRRGHALFPHVQSDDWRSEVRDSRKLNFHRDDEPWRFKPSGLVHFHRHQLYQRLRSAFGGGAVKRVRALAPSK